MTFPPFRLERLTDNRACAADISRPASQAPICSVAGYGEGATGYIPTEQHLAEGDPNLDDWCWVVPGSEPRMLAAIRQALQDDRFRIDLHAP